MRLLLAFASLTVAFAVLATGCGGGSDRLSKADYETQVGTIAVGLTEAIQEVGAATTVKGTVKALEQCQAAFESAADDLDAIVPPADIQDDHEALATAVREFGEQLNPIIGRVARGNRLAVAGVQALPALAKIIRSSADIGHQGYDLGGPR
jgi:hypothetical protein